MTHISLILSPIIAATSTPNVIVRSLTKRLYSRPYSSGGSVAHRRTSSSRTWSTGSSSGAHGGSSCRPRTRWLGIIE